MVEYKIMSDTKSIFKTKINEQINNGLSIETYEEELELLRDGLLYGVSVVYSYAVGFIGGPNAPESDGQKLIHSVEVCDSEGEPVQVVWEEEFLTSHLGELVTEG